MTTDAREEAERQLDRIRRDFEARLNGMIEEIACAWHAARAATDQVAAMNSLTEQVQRLAGNAAFFGLTKVSRDASELEEILKRIANQPDDAGLIEANNLVGALQMHSADSR